jgi:hypothetical protein
MTNLLPAITDSKYSLCTPGSKLILLPELHDSLSLKYKNHYQIYNGSSSLHNYINCSFNGPLFQSISITFYFDYQYQIIHVDS